MRILFWATAATSGFLSFRPVLGVKFVLAVCARRLALGAQRGASPGSRAPPLVGVSNFCCAGGVCARRFLLDDLGDDARADGAAALANREAQTGIHGDGLDQLDLH